MPAIVTARMRWLGLVVLLAGAILARPLGLVLANLGELALMGGFSVALMG